jgi:hypothetical protein
MSDPHPPTAGFIPTVRPDTGRPPEEVNDAYATLLRILAHDEPDALRRTLATMAEAPEHSPAVSEALAVDLGRGWLAAAGQILASEPAEGPRRHNCSFPAHIVFEIVGPTTERGAQRVAQRLMHQLMDKGTPLGMIPGAFPGLPRVLNVVIWPGLKADASTDVVEMEGYDP